MNSGAQPTALSDSENGSSVCFPETLDPYPPDVEALRRLSDNLSSLFQSPEEFDFCADARITTASTELAVHRCVLSARSPFFRDVFGRSERSPASPVTIELKELIGEFDVAPEALALVLEYLYSGRVGSLPKGVCICADDECSHAGCRPAVDFMLQLLYTSFSFQISELVSLFQRHLIDILNWVAIDDIPVILSVANLCSRACGRLMIKCVEIVVKSDLDIVTLEKALPSDIVRQIMEASPKLRSSGFPDKHVRRIYSALDSDDMELVKMLLKEGHTCLDAAYALHYAAAHCDSRIMVELLNLDLADVNLRNPRGYTVLHVAAMRKEPKIILSLLTKEARTCDLTLDGRSAVHIAKRLAMFRDYYRTIEDGKPSPKERLCVGILVHAERRGPPIEEPSVLAMAGDDLLGRLVYLENRVALAQMLYPTEAKLAMDIAQVNGTLEFTTLGTNQRPTLELFETTIKEKHLPRMKALLRTVQLGKCYFPRCAEVLDKIMDDDLADLASIGHTASDERRKRYLELQDVIARAFTEDKEEFGKSSLSLSSSTSRAGK